MTQPPYSLSKGQTPILISMPHNSSEIPSDLKAGMQDYAQLSPDTDWFVDRLYAMAAEMGIGILKPHYSRYVIDLNRPPDDTNLYPGADTTGLCPVNCFDRRPIYLPGQEPTQEDIQSRIQKYWQPYHQALQTEIQRLYDLFGTVLVYDAHSIASHVPRFFDGQLPDLNLGTHNSRACSPELEAALVKVAEASEYTWVLNGRFKGGYITRHYAQTDKQIYCFQLELSQATYMNEQTGEWHQSKAVKIQKVLCQILEALQKTIKPQTSA